MSTELRLKLYCHSYRRLCWLSDVAEVPPEDHQRRSQTTSEQKSRKRGVAIKREILMCMSTSVTHFIHNTAATAPSVIVFKSDPPGHFSKIGGAVKRETKPLVTVPLTLCKHRQGPPDLLQPIGNVRRPILPARREPPRLHSDVSIIS